MVSCTFYVGYLHTHGHRPAKEVGAVLGMGEMLLYCHPDW